MSNEGIVYVVYPPLLLPLWKTEEEIAEIVAEYERLCEPFDRALAGNL